MKPVYCLLLALSLVLATAPACAMQDSDQETDTMTDNSSDEKVLYALGLAMSQSLGQFDLSEDELEQVQKGLADGVLGNDPEVDVQEYMMKIQEFAKGRADRVVAAEREAGVSVIEQAAAEEGAVKTESGMVFRSLEEGTGPNPSPADQVTVHYKGTLRDGTTFDSSYDRGQPATFGLNQVVPCWTEGVQRMKEGGKAKLTCPPDLAYGDRAAGAIPPGATLTFEVELIKVGSATPAPAPEMSEGDDSGAGGSGR
jgi:FKBP-type peptidyl-prolyl cis-trans isomerase FkpA